MTAPVHYAIALRSPEAHIFEVRCTVSDPAAGGQAFRLPAWIPGSYMIREFARNFVSVRAESGGAPVTIAKTAKDTWQAAPCAGALTVIAEVYAWDLSVRGAHFDSTHAFFNGTSLFLAPVEMEMRPCDVDITPPAGDAYAQWRVITSLPRAGAPAYGFGRYRAADYDELIDHPVEMGTFTLGSFEAGGARHDIAITGRHDCDMERLCADVRKICVTQIDFFGGEKDSRAPMDYYAFLTMALGDAYGGLEHRASTALVIGRDKLPRAGQREVTDDYLEFLGLVSHEYFHTWNVKRIKPEAFFPYDLTKEAYTRQLWIFEGFTSYYDNLLLLRSGVITLEQYLTLIGQDITKVLRGSGRTKQSVAESSFDAWIKYYRQDENAPNSIVSYYVKGALVGMLLDLHLRANSSVSLDDVMRALWRRHGEPGRGVPEDAVLAIAMELSGLELSGFFARYVDGTDELPLREALAGFGIQLNLRAAEGNKDAGGKGGKGGGSAKAPPAPAAAHSDAADEEGTVRARPDGSTSPQDERPRLWLGARWTAGGDARLTHVFDGGPAQAAGLSANDVIVAWDGLKVSANSLHGRISRMAPGARAKVHVFRRDELMTFEVAPLPAPVDTCWLTIELEAAPERAAARAAWLSPAAS